MNDSTKKREIVELPWKKRKQSVRPGSRPRRLRDSNCCKRLKPNDWPRWLLSKKRKRMNLPRSKRTDSRSWPIRKKLDLQG